MIKAWQKIWCYLVALVMLFCSIPSIAMASSTGSYTPPGESYTLEYKVDSSGVCITGYTGALPSALTIPNSINGAVVSDIGIQAFQGCTALQAVVLSEGIRTLWDSAFADCTSLRSVTLPSSNYVSVASGTFSGCSALLRINNSESIALLGTKAFSGCTQLSTMTLANFPHLEKYALSGSSFNTITYLGTETEWNSLYYINNSDVPLNTTISCTAKTNDTPLVFNDGGKLSCRWGPGLFETSAYTYSNDLAIAGLDLSAAAETSKDRVANELQTMGFTHIQDNGMYDKENNYNNPACTIGSQELTINGERRLVIAVVIRGTTTGIWGDTGTDIWSAIDGFRTAGENVKTFLDMYLTWNKPKWAVDCTNVDNITLFITGHSLGGAAANRLVQELKSYNTHDTFVYTYAPARCDVDGGKTYNNVHNIINLQDAVPTLPLNKSRVGKNIYYSIVQSKYLPTFRSMTGQNHLPYPVAFANPVNFLLDVTDKFFGYGNHSTYTYMTYLLYSANNSPSTQVSHHARYARVACPVDMKVYDANGNVLCQVIDGAVTVNVESDIVQCWTYENEKYFAYYGEEDITVEIIGTGDGEMSYSVASVELTENNEFIEETKVFPAVEITEGSTLTSRANAGDDARDVQLFVMKEDGITVDREVIVEAHQHEYVTKYDETDHWQECECGDKKDSSIHSYSNDADTTCNDCGYTRTIENSNNSGSNAGGETPSVSPTPTPPAPSAPPASPVSDATEDKPIVFPDVPADAYYADAVAWAIKNRITVGTSETTFSPDNPCTRAQAVTFLWRAAGKPEPKGDATFSDVKSGSYYDKAVRWAVEKGITSGTGNGKFSPDEVCSRAQIVTLLYRFEGSPNASGNRFEDVPAQAYYTDAVAWAVDKGVTSGTGNNQFSPNSDCTRGQIVTFLYRNFESDWSK